MSAYADSSALVKLYADERDHDVVHAQHPLVVATLTRIEVPAAIWRKHRHGELAAADAALLVAAFEADYHGSAGHEPRFGVVDATATVLESAARLVGVHELPPAEALHLASAKATAEAVPDCRTLASFNPSLRRAAAAEGFALLPAQLAAPENPGGSPSGGRRRRFPLWPGSWRLSWRRRAVTD